MKKLKVVAAGDLPNMSDADFLATCKKIAKLTDINNHTEARIMGAKLLADSAAVTKSTGAKFIAIYKAIRDIAEAEGHLPHEVDRYRYETDKRMWDIAEQMLVTRYKKPELYKAFQSAF